MLFSGIEALKQLLYKYQNLFSPSFLEVALFLFWFGGSSRLKTYLCAPVSLLAGLGLSGGDAGIKLRSAAYNTNGLHIVLPSWPVGVAFHSINYANVTGHACN